MNRQDFQFTLLGSSVPFEPFLSHELSKRARLWHPTAQELPLNDPGLISAFLTLQKPNAVFFGPSNKKNRVPQAERVLLACAHALQTEESLLVSWSFNETETVPAFQSNCLFFKLPEIIFNPHQKNFISDCIHLFLKRRRIAFNDQSRTRLLGSRLFSKMASQASFQCLSNPRLCGRYSLHACGNPTKTQIAERVYITLQKLLPEKTLAKAEFVTESCSQEESFGGNEDFMLNFGVILPDWKQQIDEAVAYQLPLLEA